jgi:hypothetical protein
MPASVWFGNFGNVLTVGGINLLASFKNFKADVSVKRVDHTGVHDVAEYGTVRHVSLKITIDAWTPAEGSSAFLLAGKRVEFVGDVGDGVEITGTFDVTSGGISGDDNPGSTSLSLESFGPWNLGGVPYGDPATWNVYYPPS